jgi:hypothetical protein
MEDTNARTAREAGAKATLWSTILLECHQSYGKSFMTTMKKYYKFSDWKSTKDNRNIGPQTETILLVFYDIPCFFSQSELKVFLGYVSPNHNVDGASIKMVEEEMLVKLKQLTRLEHRYTIWDTLPYRRLTAPNYQTRMPDKTNSWNPSTFAQITDTELETKDKLQQEHPPATSVKSRQLQKRVVSHHWQRRVDDSTRNNPYSPPTKNLPKIPLIHPQKIKMAH